MAIPTAVECHILRWVFGQFMNMQTHRSVCRHSLEVVGDDSARRTRRPKWKQQAFIALVIREQPQPYHPGAVTRTSWNEVLMPYARSLRSDSRGIVLMLGGVRHLPKKLSGLMDVIIIGFARAAIAKKLITLALMIAFQLESHPPP
ncbi:hypothetical protein [Mesorhizobium sp.]|uniref:hypothetical protein n=1 Tax=Mesorhizobium sp. TaxID=1871066 RepID=UPI000FE81BF9|nr:hypothetical protein [Mesorhizobium sp.]RWG25804.1 MAG: hypothetical protein EOQ60_28860 [Mesorhizobium sp.]TIS17855.1 MAG: hypothetical protein E5X10_01920 [Mesorhizobium sp.]